MDTISSLSVPLDENFDVCSSSFFQRFKQLPSPDEVRSHARDQYLAGTNWGNNRRRVVTGYNARPAPSVFKSMGVFVKWGSDMRIAEGQTLYAIRHHLKKKTITVPEIYGWRTDQGEVFLYMEVISGRTLEQAWQEMDASNRLRICSELRTSFDDLRKFQKSAVGKYIGNIARGPLYDRAISLKYMAEAGPFTSVKEFHDWFTNLFKRLVPDPENIPNPYRQDLSDDFEIVFTHKDLHPSNIILSSSDPPRVLAIIDWEQPGWLPAYWEDRKAHYTCSYTGAWSETYLPIILGQYKETWDPWDWYTTSMGCCILRAAEEVRIAVSALRTHELASSILQPSS
ncbi:phosphotransferase enzyme family protein [Clohesyomyces aquaticus]|uniref:Phosphotransferase enzyme family protein n=1 Tax=Clohesyomyces aquaticus TaxID=1231657 RepID=A0A1Y1ZGK2_9PLEO|nr:phosphotransferase enzyme family protein [Clohesyomyces aquaticus]